MTKSQREVLAYIRTPEVQAKAFELDYFPWRPENVARVVLLRHRNPEPEADDFTCHDAETGRNLGWGEDKTEAESNARWKLSEEYCAANPVPIERYNAEGKREIVMSNAL